MMTVEVKVNGRLVKWIGITNVHPYGITEENKHEVHPYHVCEGSGKEVGFVTHCRKDGILHLLDQVTTMIGWKLRGMKPEDAKKLGDPV